MFKLRSALVASCFLFAGALPLLAQQMGAPPILLLQYEYVKPGHTGSAHAATESAYIKAFKDAKFDSHYLGMESLSGNNRALFLTGYGSFAEFEKDFKTLSANSLLATQVDTATAHDGEHLTESGQSFYMLDKSMSYKEDSIDPGAAHYWEITRIKVKPGHETEFYALAKMYDDVTMKLSPEFPWAGYSSLEGNENGGIFMFFTPLKSLADKDKMIAEGEKMPATLGEGGMKKLGELEAASVESMSTNLFAVNPNMSYAAESWTKEDPAFWGAK
jgi:hypothetical protein